MTAHDALVTQAAAPAGRVGARARGRLRRRHRRAATRHRARRAVSSAPRARTPSSSGAASSGSSTRSCLRRSTDGELDVDALAWSSSKRPTAASHVTIDLVGGRYVEVDIAAAALRGRIVLVGAIAGTSAHAAGPHHDGQAPDDLRHGAARRDAEEKAAATAAFVRDVVPLLADGRIAPVVDAVLPARSRGRGLRAGGVRHDVRQGHPRLPLSSSRSART